MRVRIFVVTFTAILLLAGLEQRFSSRAALSLLQADALRIESDASAKLSVAPDALARAIGRNLATRSCMADPAQPLPTSLCGTSLQVDGRRAELLAVSPEQIKFLVPAATTPGEKPVLVEAEDGTVTRGSAQVLPVAPGVYTKNRREYSVPDGYVVRVKADGTTSNEAIEKFDPATNEYLPKAIEWGDAGDNLFLVLYLTGLRHAKVEDVQVLIGGTKFTPDYIGPQPQYRGQDQLNVKLDRGVSGLLNLVVTTTDFTDFNACQIEIAVPLIDPGLPKPQVTSISPVKVEAGSAFEIAGSNYSANVNDNKVFITDSRNRTLEALLDTAHPSSLRAFVPFGAGTGELFVRSPQGESRKVPITLETSMSGFVQNQRREPIPGVVVRVPGTNITATTNQYGSFVLPKVAAADRVEFEVDGTTVASDVKYPKVPRSMPVEDARDNQYRGDRPELANIIELQPTIGTIFTFDEFALAAETTVRATRAATAAPEFQSAAEQERDVIFTLPAGTQVTFPSGTGKRTITLTTLERERTPSILPVTRFSSTIVQLTPFGARFSKGGKLTFPNTDNIPVGTPVRLFKFDVRGRTTNQETSRTLGNFIDVGPALVSPDGQQIETAAGAIDETSYYFVSRVHPTVTLYGHVIEANGRPVHRAVVQARGQATFTDSNGGFVLRDVPVLKPNDQFMLEVSYMRPDFLVERTQRTITLSGNRTSEGRALFEVAPDLVLPPLGKGKQPPVILSPPSLTLEAGKIASFNFVVYDPESAQEVAVTATGVEFATVTRMSQKLHALRFAPPASAAGTYALLLKAQAANGLSLTQAIALNVRPEASPPLFAQDQSVVLNEDTTQSIVPVLGEGRRRLFQRYLIVRQPTRGVLQETRNGWSYTPNPNYHGADSFSFKALSGTQESNVATVYLAIQPVNDRPTLNAPGPQIITAGQTVSFKLDIQDVDPEQSLSFESPNQPKSATLTQLNATTWQFSWTPTVTEVGTHAVSFRVTDTGEPRLSVVKTVVLTVDSVWAKTSGPGGFTVNAVSQAGNALMAVATRRNYDSRATERGGLLISLDNGRLWSPVGKGLPTDQSLLSFAGTARTLFVGTGIEATNTISQGKGVYRSTDNGQTWTAANEGLPQGAKVTSLAVVQGKVIAGMETSRAFDATRIFRSDDEGQSWVAIDAGVRTSDLIQLVVVGQTLFARVTNDFSTGALFRSSDAGRSWTEVGKSFIAFRNFTALTGANGVLYAAIKDGSFPNEKGRVFRSADLGDNWTEVVATAPLPKVITALAGSRGTLLAGTASGMYRLAENDSGWKEVNYGLANYNVRSLSVIGSVIFAGIQDGGIFQSSDGGLNWTDTNLGLVNSFINTLAVNDKTLFAGTDFNGVFRSFDQGQVWTNVLPNLTIATIATSGSTILAGTLETGGPGLGGSLPGEGIFRSTDNGTTWKPINNGLPINYLRTNRPAYYGIIALGIRGNTYFAMTHAGPYVSANNGEKWEPMAVGISLANITAFATIGNTIFAATDEYLGRGSARGVFRSTDGGQSWVRTEKGLQDSSGLRAGVKAMIAFHQTLFVGTVGGLYKTTDQGDNWTLVKAGLPGFTTYNAFAASGNNLFVGTENQGVFRSKDGGANWEAVNVGLPPSSSALAPISAMTVSGTDLYVYAYGVYRSTDQGATWTAADNGIPNAALSLAAKGNTLFAGIFYGGVYRSTDKGATWVSSSVGLPTTTISGRVLHERVYALAVEGDTVYAGTEDGIFRSTDDGQSWTPVNRGLLSYTDGAIRVEALGVSGKTLLAGTYNGGYRSTDQGANWMPLGGGLPSFGSFAATPTALFAGTATLTGPFDRAFGGTGLFRSTDEGKTWSPIYTGFSSTALDILSVTATENAGGTTVYAGTQSGRVWRSDDGGNNWELAGSGLDSLPVVSLAAVKDKVFAALFRSDFSTRPESQIFISTNRGFNWRKSGTGLPTTSPSYALTVLGNSLFAGSQGDGVYRFADTIQSWTDANEGLSNRSVNAVIVSGSELLAGTLGAGVFSSADNGAKWTPTEKGLPAGANVFALAVGPGNLYAGTFGDGVYRLGQQSQTWVAAGLTGQYVNALVTSGEAVLAGTGNGFDEGGVFRSTDQGKTWAAVGLTGQRVLALAAGPAALYAGTDGGGLFVSTDQGKTWRAAGNKGLTSLDVRCLAVRGATLYAGTLSGGVFRSTDEGQNWTPVNTGLPPKLPVLALAVSGSNLFAGTVNGVFRSLDQGANWVQINAGLRDVVVTSLVITGNNLVAGTKTGGVFISQF